MYLYNMYKKKQNLHLIIIYLQAITLLFVCGESLKPSDYSTTLNRSSFPAGFLFGAGSSAYQYEGAANADGRRPSIWDTFVMQFPEKILDHSTGNIADEFYYLHKEDISLMKEMGLDSFRFSISWPRVLPRGKLSGGVNWEGVNFYNYLINELLSNEKILDHSTGNIADEFYYLHKEDIALMKEMGLDSFRFSISWPRVLPRGKLSGGVNWEGVNFYNYLINELLSNDIQPFVTLFHWDLPQDLEDEYGGFLSPKIVNDYRDYAEFCFQQFGDRVKYWISLNEPNLFSEFGYARGLYAPGRCSNYIGNCTEGNSATEPYLVAHHLILSHAAAVMLYRNKYQATQKGIIGITIDVRWQVPKYQTVSSRTAAFRFLDFHIDWIVHPMTFGYYPKTMRYLVGNRLPKFTEEQTHFVKGSLDFVGLNYYTSRYAEDSNSSSTLLSYTTDSHVHETVEKNGILIGILVGGDWLYMYPKGILEMVLYMKKKYSSLPIYITENGMADANNSSLPVEEALNDDMRIIYHYLHLSYLLQAIKKGADVRGYLVWSFLDDFEWASGYTTRFGFTYVDYNNKLKRYLKKSAFWFKDFLQKENVTSNSSLLFIQ